MITFETMSRSYSRTLTGTGFEVNLESCIQLKGSLRLSITGTGSGSRAWDGRSLRREQLIQQWEQLIRRWEQLICGKVVGLSEKSYHFLAGTANMGKIL